MNASTARFDAAAPAFLDDPATEAAVRSRLADTAVVVEVRPMADLDAFAAPLADLARRAVVANVFFEPVVLKAALAEARHPDRVFMVLAWADRQRAMLSGVWPIVLEPHHWGPSRPVWFTWKHDSGTRATPLIGPGAGPAVWAAMLDAIAATGRARHLVLPTMMDLSGLLSDITHAADATRRRLCLLERHPHIVLGAISDGEAHLKSAMSARRRKRMVKNRDDLAALGRLEARVYERPGDVMVAFRRFVELEGAGWKGRRKGAILTKPDALRFFLRTVCDLAEAGQVRIDSLELDGAPLAMSIVTRSGNAAFCWKTTYDEAYARFSPGMLVVMDVTRGIAADPGMAFADSCTDAGHPLMAHLWPETADSVDLLVDLKPGASAAAFAAARATELGRRRARAALKKAYHAIRDRAEPLRG
ncbi:GNAT family N-acetyltransferase [Rhodobium gokarnense]|uniref:CelD/BcsL family acetyltransferase involved in cellulose biosynthesis n=1 Tax=Rhodobium gokarnense TaxID=364296 RepID=A0ABT3HCP8_9HYPH|nr:GNAT family N-acetyltransferase [Rhodobium gokarnense]MCW2308152.1 CelD/BcsL family acetyltransferase involved in cellulose biosynthesis [Rhodobium gokarnense]